MRALYIKEFMFNTNVLRTPAGGKAEQLATKMRRGKLVGTRAEPARDKAVY